MSRARCTVVPVLDASEYQEAIGDALRWGQEILQQQHTPLAEMVLPERGSE